MDIILEMRAEELGLAFDKTNKVIEALLTEAISNLAQQTYSEAVALAHERLNTTRQDYIDNLDLKVDLNNKEFTLYLNPQSNPVEGGYGPYDMKPGLLNGPNAKVGKNGNRYNTVPFEHHPSAGGVGNYNKAIRTPQMIQGELAKTIQTYGLDKIIKDSGNKALEGKVATLKAKNILPELQGLTKYQKMYEKATQSTYFTFRRVSDNSSAGSWIHPGFKGVGIFSSLEDWIRPEVDNILKNILST